MDKNGTEIIEKEKGVVKNMTLISVLGTTLRNTEIKCQKNVLSNPCHTFCSKTEGSKTLPLRAKYATKKHSPPGWHSNCKVMGTDTP